MSGKERVVENEAGYVMAEREPGNVVEPCVLAGEDATETRLSCSGGEAVERARYAGQRR